MPAPGELPTGPFPDEAPLDPAEMERQAAQARAGAAAASIPPPASPPTEGGGTLDALSGIADVGEVGGDIVEAVAEGTVSSALEASGEVLSGALEALSSGGEVLGGCAEG